jgi:hypothetical protein
MIDQVSPPLRKFAAVGLLLAAALLAINFVITPVASRLAYVERALVEKRERVGRLIILARASRDARTIDRESETLLSRAVYLPGDSEAVQLANLQAQLLGVTDKAGIRVQSSRTLTASPREGLQAVGMEITLQSDIRKLQGLMHRIESHRPVLIVDRLAIAPSHGATPTGPLAEGTLQVNLRVLALVQPSSGSQL